MEGESYRQEARAGAVRRDRLVKSMQVEMFDRARPLLSLPDHAHMPTREQQSAASMIS